MNSEDLMQDPIITGLITEVRKEDPSREEARTAVDRLKRRLGSRLAPSDSRAQPSPGSRGSMLRLGIAAAVVGTVTLSLWTPTRQIGAGVVFGQVLDVVRQATSMTYTLIEDLPGGGEDIVQVDVHRSRWLRLVSAGKGTRILDLQDAKLLRFDHPRQPAKHADLYTLVGPAAQALRSVCANFTPRPGSTFASSSMSRRKRKIESSVAFTVALLGRPVSADISPMKVSPTSISAT